MALSPDSPAIDGGDGQSWLTNDQRGELRPVGGAPDIGAFESSLTGTHAGVLQIRPYEKSTYISYESDPSAVITIHRAGTARGPASVRLTTSDDTALEGIDYRATNVMVAFADGEHTKDVLVPLIDNIAWDGSRRFLVHLSEPAGSSLGSSVSTVFINDDECAFSFDSASQHVSEGQYASTLTVHRDGFIGRTASVRYTTIAGTAQAGSDFVQVSSVLTFASNQYSATIEIPLLEDNEVEPDETFSIQLSDPIGGELGTIASTLLTIHDHRPALVVTNCDEETLRTAIAAAGFTSGSVFFDCDGIITLTAPLVITNELVRLNASGHDIVLSGGYSNRVFEVLPGASLTLVNLTIRDGVSTNGGGILVDRGQLHATGCRFGNNLAQGAAGRDEQLGASATSGGMARGGAIFGSSAVLMLTNNIFLENRAKGGMGGVVGNLTFAFPDGGSASGGAVAGDDLRARLKKEKRTNHLI